uniref:hypothetical protein n=1 Tax=Escherichia coli TaxID=562 RepID=UPI0011E921E9|nr:hypothetical protein [Escherichia coli]
MLIPFQARNGAAYSDPGSSLDLPRFSLGSVYWIYAVDKLNKPANKAGWKEAVLFYALDKKTMFIDRNLNPKKIKKTPKNGCLFNTACVP